MILTSQSSTRGPIIGHDAQELEAQEVFLNTFENIINRRVNISEDKLRFQKALQYARSKVDYSIGEGIYMLLSDMNLRIGKVKNYNNKILTSKPGFKLGTNLKINLDEEKGKPDVKPKNEPNIEPNKGHKQDVKPNIKFDREHKPNIKSNKENKQDVKMMKTEPDTNGITYE